jgi:hypothetical protein
MSADTATSNINTNFQPSLGWPPRMTSSGKQAVAARSVPGPLTVEDLVSILRSVVEPVSGIDTRQFLAIVDYWQKTLYRRLVDHYHNELYCQLLALKTSNLLVRSYELARRRRFLVSRPFHLFVDPANGCQLACPGCIHTANRSYATYFNWPKGFLEIAHYEAFLSNLGPFASLAMLYNYGEPLLHSQFSDISRLSDAYLLYNVVSTNLSLTIDPESLVNSGLDWMILSIDGTTSEVYERYRCRGRLELVLDNVRSLVEARSRAGSVSPYLKWQFLTFEHNHHQVKDAIALSRTLGVDCISVETPFSVSWDDPEIRSIESPLRGVYEHRPYHPRCANPEQWNAAPMTALIAPHIQAAFHTTWQERLQGAPGMDDTNCSAVSTCLWLYDAITLDAVARIMPCCMSPSSDRNLLFSHLALDGSSADLVNSPMAVLARSALADPPQFQTQAQFLPPQEIPYCTKCSEKSVESWHFPSVQCNFRRSDPDRVVPDSFLDHFAA